MTSPNPDVYSTFTKEQLEGLLLDARGGPIRGRIQQALLTLPLRTATVQTVAPVPATLGDFALKILTPEQRKLVEDQYAAATSTTLVASTTATLADATQQVLVAAQAVQAAIADVPAVVDITTAQAAVAIVQPVINAMAPDPAPEPTATG